MSYSFPPGYPPLAFCRTCGRDFSGDRMFDRHRVGSYEHDWSMDHPDSRRCLTDQEMREKGWRPLTEDELRNSRRDGQRYGFGIEMWVDPSEWARAARTLKSVSGKRRSRSQP